MCIVICEEKYGNDNLSDTDWEKLKTGRTDMGAQTWRGADEEEE